MWEGGSILPLPFLTLALDGCMWSVSHLGCFTPRNETMVHIKKKFVWAPELVWLLWKRAKFLPCTGSWITISGLSSCGQVYLWLSCASCNFTVVLFSCWTCCFGSTKRMWSIPEKPAASWTQQHPYFVLPRSRQHNLLEHGASTWKQDQH